MEDFLKKISSYNVFTNLLPGIIVCLTIEAVTPFSILSYGVLIAFFVYYIIGVVVSRIGSLWIEWLIEKSGFVKQEPYEDYIEASKENEDIKLFQESLCTYRSLLAAFIVSGFVFLLNKIYEWLPEIWPYILGVVWILLILIFLFSYKKQTNYICKRVRHYVRSRDDKN